MAKDFPGGAVDETHLPMQGTQARSLVQEDPTCRGATIRKVHFPSVQLPGTLEPSVESPPNWKVLLDGSGRGGQAQCGL